MIKINRSNKTVVLKESYPCLKISHNQSRIVLFTGPKTGYEMCSEWGKYGFLDYDKTWPEESFTLYNGTIELTNDL